MNTIRAVACGSLAKMMISRKQCVWGRHLSMESILRCHGPKMPRLRKPLDAVANMVGVHGRSSCFEECQGFLNLYKYFS